MVWRCGRTRIPDSVAVYQKLRKSTIFNETRRMESRMSLFVLEPHWGSALYELIYLTSWCFSHNRQNESGTQLDELVNTRLVLGRVFHVPQQCSPVEYSLE